MREPAFPTGVRLARQLVAAEGPGIVVRLYHASDDADVQEF